MHFRVGTTAINRSAHGKLVHPVPYTGGVPGDLADSLGAVLMFMSIAQVPKKGVHARAWASRFRYLRNRHIH